MYKTRNTGTGNGMRGMGGMLYSGECRQTFRGVSSNIPGNVAKDSGERCLTFRQTFLAAGWCTGKQLRLGQALRNLTCGDLEISLVVIGQGVTRLKKTGFVYFLDLFEGRVRGVEGGEVVVWFHMCGAPWVNDWANVGPVDVFFTYGEYVWF